LGEGEFIGQLGMSMMEKKLNRQLDSKGEYHRVEATRSYQAFRPDLLGRNATYKILGCMVRINDKALITGVIR
jgi:hypothetical protein